MILRGIHIENWRCIGKLDLDNLSSGVVVLFGPNRTGKTSLVRAIRAGLFELHSTKTVESSRPWNSDASPKIAIEFAHGGTDYQLTKVFSPRKDGQAVLQKKIGAAWQVLHRDPKEAARVTRELLGADKSDQGLNQLLWLEQGQVTLPDPKDLDTTLEQQLLHALRVLITARDRAFRDQLDKRYSKWFTPGTGNLRKGCDVLRLQQERSERQASFDALDQQYQQMERVIRDQEAKFDERPQLEAQQAEAQAEVERLDQERMRTEERRRQFAQAQAAAAAARSASELAASQLAALQAAKTRALQAADATKQLTDEVRAAEAEVQRLAGELDAAAAAEKGLADQAACVQREAEELNDYRQWGGLLQHQARLTKDLERAREKEEQIKGMETTIASTAAPSEQELAQLRKNRRDAFTFRARLDAAALTFTLQLLNPAHVELSVDYTQQVINVPAGEVRSFSLRQRITADIASVGRVEAARSHADESLETAAEKLAQLDADYAAAIRIYDQDPSDPESLDNLSKRRHERETNLARLAESRQSLTSLAPSGIAVLAAEADEVGRRLNVLQDRRPHFADAPFTDGEADNRDKALQTRTTDLAKRQASAKRQAEAARAAYQKADKDLQAQREALAGAQATEKAAQEDLQRQGDESTIAARNADCDRQLEASVRAIKAAALTPEEETVEDRFKNAADALAKRTERLVELDKQLSELRGQLLNCEGLSTRRTDAALALQAAATALDRETLQAEAHKHLREVFEQCREYQVQQVNRPISGRVLEWARHIGLHDYREICFGDQLLPEGFLPSNSARETPVALPEESCGTIEQLALLVRLAIGGILARSEPQVAILDDPLTHTDKVKHQRILEVLKLAAEGRVAGDPPAGPLQILILTCHPDRFDHLAGATQINLADQIQRCG
jgi:hypothetical protein